MSGTRPKPETLLEGPALRRSSDRPTPLFQVLRAATENTRMMHATLDELRARKRWVFAAMALAFCVSTIWYALEPPLYSSAVSFYVTPSPVPDKEAPIYLNVQTSPQALRMISTSSPMFDHLIKTFDLGKHYGLASGSPDDRIMMHGILSDRVTVDLHEEDVIAVRVQDDDRALAAAMANDIFETTRAMVRAEHKADLTRQLRIIQQVLDSTERHVSERSADLVRLAGELRAARGGLEDHTRSEQSLMKAANDVAESNKDLLLQRRNRANLLAMSDAPDSDMIRLRTEAVEEIDMHPLRSAVTGILLITLSSGLVAAALLLLMFESWFAPRPEPVPARR